MRDGPAKAATTEGRVIPGRGGHIVEFPHFSDQVMMRACVQEERWKWVKGGQVQFSPGTQKWAR